MNREASIFVDNDGTLANFIGSVCKVLDLNEQELLDRWPLGVWSIDKVLGLTETEFWDKIRAVGESFWADMELYPWADELYDFCESLAPTYVMTTPTSDPLSLSGKLKFLHKWKGNRFNNYVFTAHKERCTRADRILVDDYARNVDRFREHGGRAILFPMHTNRRHAVRHQAIDAVKTELLAWHQSLKD